MNTTEDLRRALRYTGEPSTLDTAAIIATGRRRRTAKRLLGGTGLTAVAVVAALGAMTALQPTDGPPVTEPPLAGAVPEAVLVASTSAMAATEAPEQFDPLLRTLSLGWIPAGMAGQQAEITPWYQTFSVGDPAWVNGGPDLGLSVTLLAKGRPLSDLLGGAPGLPSEPVVVPTDPINGGEAECLTDPSIPGSCSAIRWRYAPDAWARVNFAGSAVNTPEEAAAVARRVAESVVLTEGEPVRIPFALNGDLAELAAARTIVSVEPSAGRAWSASIELVPSGTVVQPQFGPQEQSLVIGASHDPGDPSGRIPRDDAPNTTVGGIPGWLSANGGALIVWGVSAARVFVEDTIGGDALAAYANVALLPDPSDPAGWPPVN